jgi:hypothetical protein
MSGTELAGRLTEIVSVERPEHSQDGIGGATGQLTQVAIIRAEISPEGVGPASEGDARAAMPRFLLTARAHPELMPGDVLVWQSRRYRTIWSEIAQRPAPVQRALIEEIR